MHSNKREEIDEAYAGDIIAVMGIDCASGETYAQEPKMCSLENMFIPEAVIKVAVNPKERTNTEKLSNGYG